MGTAADSLFNVLMSWVRALVNALWALFSADRTTALEFLGKNWMMIAVVIIVAGLVIDWLIWLLRWQPYHLWAKRMRRLLRIEEEDEEPAPKKAHAAALPKKKEKARQKTGVDAPMYLHGIDEGEDIPDVPDEELGMYPGMLYDSEREGEMATYTRSYSALTQEGPGAAEVARRREEIDAWQLQMQEEARARAEAERAERERLAREAEEQRRAQAAYAAEQARLAREAYEAEQARLAQEEYARQMAEYERQKAQYERDLAEYERQKAEYEAQMAMGAEESGQTRRRRAPVQTTDRYEDEAMQGETVMMHRAPAHRTAAKKHAEKHAHKIENTETHEKKGHAIINRMAKMIEPEEEELINRKTLPPRVDMNDAFRTAKLPVIKTGRKRP